MRAMLLALLLAAPERVVVVAKQSEGPGVFAPVRRSLEHAFRRLYEREDEDVARGNALAAQDDPEGALREYDRARTRMPEDAPLSYDRATVMLKLDPSKAGPAAAEASQALQRGDASLKPKAAYSLALAQEAMGRPEEAMAQYAAALALDPDDTDSKVNLELLLRTKEERRRNPAGQPQPNQPQQQSQQEKAQPQKGEGAQKQPQSSPQDPGERQKQQDQAQQPQEQGAEKNPQQRRDDASRRATNDKPVDRSEAQRLLDALRASEKNLEIWRFAKKGDAKRRSDPEKDW